MVLINKIDKYWSLAGGITAVLILAVMIYTRQDFINIQSLTWIHFCTLLIHQFEEYTFPGGFQQFFNRHILNKNGPMKHPLTLPAILLVNIGIGWSAYLMAALHNQKTIVLSLGLVGVTVLNGLLHTFMFIRLRKYNPGFVSGFLICLPFGVYLLCRLLPLHSDAGTYQSAAIFFAGILTVPLAIKAAATTRLKGN